MTRIWRDQYTKDVLRSLLEPLGRVTSHREIPAEPLYVDVVFEELDPSLEPSDLAHLGLLGRLVQAPGLFEPFSSSLRDQHLVNAMAKLTWSHLEVWRIRERERKEAKRERERTQGKGPKDPEGKTDQALGADGVLEADGMQDTNPSEPLPWMWVLSPSASDGKLEARALSPLEAQRVSGAEGWGWGLEPWPPGVYSLGTAWRMGVIVLDELPERRDTLLLRLLGRGETLMRALEEVQELSEDDVLRTLVMHLLLKWRIIHREAPPETEEEQEVVMLIDRTYEEWVTRTRNEGLQAGLLQGLQKGRQEGLQEGLQKGLQKGRQEGLQAGLRSAVRRAWRRRFGGLSDRHGSQLERIESSEALETLIETLVVAADLQEAEQALSQQLDHASGNGRAHHS